MVHSFKKVSELFACSTSLLTAWTWTVAVAIAIFRAKCRRRRRRRRRRHFRCHRPSRQGCHPLAKVPNFRNAISLGQSETSDKHRGVKQWAVLRQVLVCSASPHDQATIPGISHESLCCAKHSSSKIAICHACKRNSHAKHTISLAGASEDADNARARPPPPPRTSSSR